MPHTISSITPKEVAVRVATNLRRIRRIRNASRAELAHACRCHPDTIKKYESGNRTSMEALVLLLRLARALEVPLGELVG
jgi:transcriptional regulator with XRE-family HTH domain